MLPTSIFLQPAACRTPRFCMIASFLVLALPWLSRDRLAERDGAVAPRSVTPTGDDLFLALTACSSTSCKPKYV